MFELCSLLCLKLYSLNFAIAHAQNRLYCLSEFVILVLHYNTRKLFYHLKQAQKLISNYSNLYKKGKCLPSTKTNREYYINITFPALVIVENIIPRNVIINRGAAEVDNHFSREDIFDYHPRRKCDIYFIIPNRTLDPLFSEVLLLLNIPIMVRGDSRKLSICLNENKSFTKMFFL